MEPLLFAGGFWITSSRNRMEPSGSKFLGPLCAFVLRCLSLHLFFHCCPPKRTTACHILLYVSPLHEKRVRIISV